MKILVINGPNLNLLGAKEKNHYGAISIDRIRNLIKKNFQNIKFEFFQSNIEGDIIDEIQIQKINLME